MAATFKKSILILVALTLVTSTFTSIPVAFAIPPSGPLADLESRLDSLEAALAAEVAAREAAQENIDTACATIPAVKTGFGLVTGAVLTSFNGFNTAIGVVNTGINNFNTGLNAVLDTIDLIVSEIVAEVNFLIPFIDPITDPFIGTANVPIIPTISTANIATADVAVQNLESCTT